MKTYTKDKMKALIACTAIILLLLPAISTPVGAAQETDIDEPQTPPPLLPRLKIIAPLVILDDTFTVKIIDRFGNPVPFASIKIIKISLLKDGITLPQIRIGDHNGEAQFRLKEPGTYQITTTASLRQYEPGKKTIIKLGKGLLPPKLKIKVSPIIAKKTFTVKVTDRLGSPVPFAIVKIERIKISLAALIRISVKTPLVRLKTTNLKGEATFTLLNNGLYRITASATLRGYRVDTALTLKIGK